jgi:hypothetical protein
MDSGWQYMEFLLAVVSGFFLPPQSLAAGGKTAGE